MSQSSLLTISYLHNELYLADLWDVKTKFEMIANPIIQRICDMRRAIEDEGQEDAEYCRQRLRGLRNRLPDGTGEGD